MEPDQPDIEIAGEEPRIFEEPENSEDVIEIELDVIPGSID